MIENVFRNIEEGRRPFQAALHGAKEIGFTVVSLTVSLIAVFILGWGYTMLIDRELSGPGLAAAAGNPASPDELA